jgi:amino acid transporter
LTLNPNPRSQEPELERTIGRWSLVALMTNSILGAGIFGLPSLIAARLDGYSPLGCLIAGCGALIIAACIAEISSRFENTGGLYLYGREVFGRLVGLLIGWLMLLTRIAAAAAAADLFTNYLGQFVPSLHARVSGLVVLGLLIGHLALLNYVGVKTGMTVSNIFSAIKIGLLVLFIGGGLTAMVMRPELRLPQQFGRTTVEGWFEALLLLVFGYGGFEGALIVGGESQNPKRDMPFALLTALATQCFLYTSVVYVVVHTLPSAGASLRPLADAARIFLGDWGATAIGIGALISTYGYLSANLLHSARIPFSLAVQGDFPAVFARIHRSFRTPHISIVAYSVALFVFAAMGDFRWNAILSAATRLVVYGAMAVALIVMRKRNGPAPFPLPAGILFSAASMVIVLMLLGHVGKGEGIVVGVTAAVALANWVTVRKS